MALENVTEIIDLYNSTDVESETTINQTDMVPTEMADSQFTSAGSVLTISGTNRLYNSDSPQTQTLCEAFIITEIVMTALELIISIVAAIKIQKWRRNYRNQMLMQLSLARFLKRVIFLLQFLEDHGKLSFNMCLTNSLIYCQYYIDFVIVILVFFFIKHMYNTLIIVLVKISQNNLYKVSSYSWLLPMPVSAACVALIATGAMDEWWVYLLICATIKWPLAFLGTALYVTLLYRVMSDKIRKFARSLTIVTFLLCFIVNFYLISKDIIELWCLKSFATLLANYISGFIMNALILCFYIILMILSLKHKPHFSRSLPDYSLANVNVK